MKLLTIGFKGKSAEQFFGALQKAGVQKVLDVRRGNSSQLAGFTKGSDLAFFLRSFGIGYEHVPDLAPSDALRKEYAALLGHKKKDDAAWEMFVRRYGDELAVRPVAEIFRRATDGLAVACLLCSEPTAERCHRRLLAERIARDVAGVDIMHL